MHYDIYESWDKTALENEESPSYTAFMNLKLENYPVSYNYRVGMVDGIRKQICDTDNFTIQGVLSYSGDVLNLYDPYYYFDINAVYANSSVFSYVYYKNSTGGFIVDMYSSSHHYTNYYQDGILNRYQSYALGDSQNDYSIITELSFTDEKPKEASFTPDIENADFNSSGILGIYMLDGLINNMYVNCASSFNPAWVLAYWYMEKNPEIYSTTTVTTTTE